jgi:H+/Cl- antiporter ClcA
VWWGLPVLGIAGLLLALAIAKLPGAGGHLPARGLSAGGPATPDILPGVLLAGLATIGSGLVLGPEAPLIAIGAGSALLMIRAARREMPNQVLLVIGAAGSFAAISLIFESPLAAAVILIEATGLGGARLPLVLIPGLLAAGIGSLVSIGMGSFTGLSTNAYALGALPLPAFHRPTAVEFLWCIALALAIALGARATMLGGIGTYRVVRKRLVIALPLVALIVAGLAIAFSQSTSHGVDAVLFDGQGALPNLITDASGWTLGALALLILFKGLAYSLSLGSFRGGPTFPALFLGAAAGLMATHVPGLPETAAVAIGLGAGTVAILRLPLSAVLIATLLTSHSGAGVEPLIIVGVVVAYIATLQLSNWTPAFARDDGR